MTKCSNPKCDCNKVKTKLHWKCRVGLHDFHLVSDKGYICIRENCTADQRYDIP